MLDFAKFDAKKMRLHLKRVNLARVIRNQIALFQEVCRRKGLTLDCDIADGVPVVFLDHEKTERILSNLIRNAIKFTEDGAIRVRLEVEPTDAGMDEQSGPEQTRTLHVKPSGWLTMKVHDTGIGIAAHHMEKVFQRFQQVDGSSTRRYEGTGLGLAIVQEAVDLQHGSVALESAEGEGSTFIVRLPINLDEMEPEADIDRRQEDRRQEDADFPGPDRRMKPRRNEDYGKISVSDIAFVESSSIHNEELESELIAQSRPDSGIRVLYVEDSSDLRSYVSQMLRSFGHTVTTANDGVAGWQQTQEHLPDIVVSDVMMPGIDGFELLQLIKKTGATQRIPVILITAKSEVESRIEGLEIGADDYIAKPVDLRELDARIRNIIAIREFRDALTGRKHAIHLTPILWRECKADFAITDLDRRLLHGGFPEMLLADAPDPAFFEEWLASFYARDIQELFGVRNRMGFLALVRLLCLRSGGQLEISDVAKESGLSRPTVMAHLDALETAHAITRLAPYHGGGHREIIKQPRVFAFDTGLVSHVRGWESIRETDRGHLWEHLVLDELLATVPRPAIHYWRDKSQREIDFVIEGTAGEVHAVEAKVNPEAFETRGLTAFRQLHPRGTNILVCPHVREPYVMRREGFAIQVVGDLALVLA